MDADATSTLPRVDASGLDRGRGQLPAELASAPLPDAVRLTARSEGAHQVVFRLPLEATEHIAGLGEQFGQVDKRGREVLGWVGDAGQQRSNHTKGLDGGYCLAPLWYSSAGYAAFVETTERWHISFGTTEPGVITVEVPGEAASLVLVPGTPREALPVVTAMTGRAPLAPHWVYGVWKGLRGGHERTIDQARRLREEHIGVGTIWIDAHYQPDTNTGFPAAGTHPLGSYPDIVKTVRELHDLGFTALTYVNPFLYRNTPMHDDWLAKGYGVAGPDGTPRYVSGIHPFEGDMAGHADRSGLHTHEEASVLVDLTNPEAEAAWKANIRTILLVEGFDGFMQDFGEEIATDSVMADGRSGMRAHNDYPVIYHRATAEEIAASKPSAAFFTRSGYLGSQAHTTVKWPGDQDRDWSRDAGIGAVGPAGISAGLMGFVAWGPDIGGTMDFHWLTPHRGGGSEDEELWLRWCQLGAMSPVMRDHLGFHDGDPTDVWTSEATADMWRRCAAWHHAFFPYLYGLAAEACETAMPVLRGLMLDSPAHDEAWTVTDQWLLGPDVLCAPVITKGARTRRLWLPDGEWWDGWEGQMHQGPGWVEVPAPLDRWVVLQRAGTVVPTLRDVPEHLNDPRYPAGEYPLRLLRAPGSSTGQRRLHCGTVVSWVDGEVTTTGGPTREVEVVETRWG